MIKNFLSWMYSDPEYSASYYKNLIEQPPSTPKAPTTQHPNWQPPQPKLTPQGKGTGKGVSFSIPASHPIGEGAPPPIMRPPPASTQPQPQPNTASSSAHNPNPTQPVDANRVIKALFEATLGNHYSPELRKEIQHNTVELLEKLTQPIPPPEPIPTIPEKTLQERLEHLKTTTQGVTDIQKMITTLFESIDVCGLELNQERCEALLAHQDYFDRAMLENMFNYQKHEKTKQDHRIELHEHWGNPEQMEAILDPTNQDDLPELKVREQAAFLKEKLRGNVEYAKLKSRLSHEQEQGSAEQRNFEQTIMNTHNHFTKLRADLTRDDVAQRTHYESNLNLQKLQYQQATSDFDKKMDEMRKTNMEKEKARIDAIHAQLRTTEPQPQPDAQHATTPFAPGPCPAQLPPQTQQSHNPGHFLAEGGAAVRPLTR